MCLAVRGARGATLGAVCVGGRGVRTPHPHRPPPPMHTRTHTPLRPAPFPPPPLPPSLLPCSDSARSWAQSPSCSRAAPATFATSSAPSWWRARCAPPCTRVCVCFVHACVRVCGEGLRSPPRPPPPRRQPCPLLPRPHTRPHLPRPPTPAPTRPPPHPPIHPPLVARRRRRPTSLEASSSATALSASSACWCRCAVCVCGL